MSDSNVYARDDDKWCEFASAAMTSILVNDSGEGLTIKMAAKTAAQVADALMIERESRLPYSLRVVKKV